MIMTIHAARSKDKGSLPGYPSFLCKAAPEQSPEPDDPTFPSFRMLLESQFYRNE